ncbi:hypothetical protein COV18_06775 [Candidatus Woesearchaeota archaeon CG10_big_fil_rev_8_21_14_0_10_37_12]|nr:MAG: hypothetical protein COV18_06775 [Candidatus Woesearchaeota archaeon CG10_big_fil_rev_8_21_14_0_10_37_12]
MQDRVFSLLVDKDEISWKSIILDLVRSGEIDPWNVDISLLTKKYLERLHSLKESDLKVSGKVVLAASILLRLKSSKLVGADLDEFDRLIASNDLSQEQFYDELEQELTQHEDKPDIGQFELFPRLPQARRRKVSVYDLVKALDKALEVKHRRVLNYVPGTIEVPVERFDVTAAISSLFQRIVSLFAAKKQLTFKDLVRGESKEDKVFTFIPLLHLANHQKIELQQDESFGDINVTLLEGEHVNE